MKKFFTLIAVALAATSVNAQEIWSVANLDLTSVTSAPNTTATLKKVEAQYNLDGGAQPEEATVKADATAALEMMDYIFTSSTDNVTLTGVSTPNTGTPEADIWKLAGAENVKLNTTNLEAECLVEFDTQYLVAANGNPGLGVYEFYFTNSQGNAVGPRYIEDYWTPECGSAPLKGCYYKFDVKSAGKLLIGVFLNKNLASNPLYLIDAATNKLVAKDAFTVLGFRQNCNFEVEQGSTTKLVNYTLDDDYLLDVNSTGIGGGTNRPFYGYVTLDAAEGSYYLLSPKSQIGVYGFQFTAGTDGISTIATDKAAQGDKTFNLAGQQVSNGFRGIVVKNGKKFIQ